MKLFIGADHGGFEQKQVLIDWLKSQGHDVFDCGNTVLDVDDDYPDYAFKVGESVAKTPNSLGILVCRSSAGMVIAANKVKGIRAVSYVNEESAKHARQHNDANIIGLSGDWTTIEEMKTIILAFITAPFSKEKRHIRRIEKIQDYEDRK